MGGLWEKCASDSRCWRNLLSRPQLRLPVPSSGLWNGFLKDHAFFTGYFWQVFPHFLLMKSCTSKVNFFHFIVEYILVLFKGGASGEDRDNVGTQHGGMLS